MSAFLLVAGCSDYQPTHDTGVVKISSEGLPEWSLLINNSLPGPITETSDGNYLLSTEQELKYGYAPTPQSIKISHSGTVLLDNSGVNEVCGAYDLALTNEGKVINLRQSGLLCPPKSTGEYAEGKTQNFTVRGLVISTSDNGHIVAGYSKNSVPLTKREFIERRQSQLQETQEYAEWLWNAWCANSTNADQDPGDCKSKPVFTSIVVKNNPDGTVSWQHDFPNYSTEVSSIIEMKSGKGYIANFGDVLLRFSPDGRVTNISLLEAIPEYVPQPDKGLNAENYSMIAKEGGRNVALLFDQNGIVTHKEYLPGGTMTATRDGGFLVVSTRGMSSPSSYASLSFATRYNPDGSISWEKPIMSDAIFQDQTKVIQTSEGGYLIVSSRMYSRDK